MFALLLTACSSQATAPTTPSTILLPETSVPAARSFHFHDVASDAINDGNTWRARVTVAASDDTGEPVEGAHVVGRWSADADWPAECTTAGDGSCDIESDSLRKRTATVELEIYEVEHARLTYAPERNAVPDPDQRPLTVVVRKP